MNRRTLSAAAAAKYAHALRNEHVLGKFGAPQHALEVVDDDLRRCAQAPLSMLLSVADFDAGSASSCALAESLYADPISDALAPRPWQRVFLKFVEQNTIAWIARPRPLPAKVMVNRVVSALMAWAPDAPAPLLALRKAARRGVESAVAQWLAEWPKRFRQIDQQDSEVLIALIATRAVRLARVWCEACDVEWKYRRHKSRAKKKPEDEVKSPWPGRSGIITLNWLPAPGRPKLLQASSDFPSDLEAVRVHEPATAPFPIDRLDSVQAGQITEPLTAHWRVAATVASDLSVLAGRLAGEPYFILPEAMREIARKAVESLLLVAWFSHARTIDIDYVKTIFERWLAVRSRGMLAWQSYLVWYIEEHFDEIDSLLAAKKTKDVDARLREATGALRAQMPRVFRQAAPSLAQLSVRLTRSHGSRAAVTPHGLARRWCACYQAEFPKTPSAQRPAKTARRLVVQRRRVRARR